MTDRIFQKHPDGGTREFTLVDDAIEYRISDQFVEEELSVVLSVLVPEPVVDGRMMYFISEVNREALIKMYVDLPDPNTFRAFVDTVKQRVRDESFGQLAADNRESAVTQAQIDTTIRMLETYLDADSIENLLSALRGLSANTDSRAHLDHVVDAFNELGVQQGPVLTYAPFFNTLLASTDLDDLS
jgi:hypothetical protein